jgi:endonuclease/exonuclease/phosphatase family metal-dependent hydrolase
MHNLFTAICFSLSLSILSCTDEPPLITPRDTESPIDDSAADARARTDIALGPPVTLTLATFNVHNFFDENNDPAKQDEVPTAAEVAAKIKALGAALRVLKADVLALQEVENKALVDRLNSGELSSLGYANVRLVPGNDLRGINVALLSRFPVPKLLSHHYDTFPGVDGDTKTYGFSRDCLEATVEPSAGRTLVLLINHLRASDESTDTTDAINRRKAQAARVRQIADEILRSNASANLAVLGDMNDTPDSRTLQLLKNGNPALFDLLTLAPAADRYTHFYSGSKEQIDYILAAPGLKADLIAGSVQASHDAVFKSASDHYPVSARFNLN